MANYNSNNLIGQRFGLLTVIEKTTKRTSNRSIIWKCQCDCGNSVEVATPELKRQDGKGTRSCGCLKQSNIDLIGKQFGELTVLQLSDQDDGHRHKKWKCQCSCGTVVYVTTHDLTRTDGKQRRSCNQKCSNVTNEIGNCYGKLTVLSRDNSKTNGSGAYWICQCSCGNVISVQGHSLRSGNTTSCGCIKSKGEEKIGLLLKKHGIKFKTQYSFSDLTSDKGAKLRFDFCILDKSDKLVGLIEYQGQQHYEIGFGQSEEEFQMALARDQKKEIYCIDKKIPLLIIPYTDYEKINISYILQGIINKKKECE